MKHFLAPLLLAMLLLAAPAQAQTANVGIGTSAPTQKLDVDGTLRLRALSGADNRLPLLRSDGTLGVNPPAFGTAPTGSVPLSSGSAATNNAPSSVAVSGTMAYVVNSGSNNLQLFDCSDATAPVKRTAVGYPTISVPSGVAVSGTMAYVVCYGSNSLQLIDCGNPTSPFRRSTTATGTNPASVAVSGTTAYVVSLGSNILQVFDCSNPAAPVLLNPTSPGGTTGGTPTAGTPRSVALSGTTAYVACTASDILQVFDCSNPAAPVLRNPTTPGGTTGGTPTGNAPFGVAVSGTTAYVVNYNSNTLQLFDCSNPAAPVLRNSTTPGGTTGGTPAGTTSTDAYSVAVSGTTAYVLNRGSNFLQLFDCSNPAAPVLRNPTAPGGTTGGIPTGQAPSSVAVGGTTAYVVGYGSNTLQVFAASVGQAQVAVVNPNGTLAAVPLASLTDNLGNHTATQDLDLGPHQLVGNGGSQGLSVASSGAVTMPASLSLPFRTVPQGAGSYQDVTLTAADHTVRSGSPPGVVGGAVFSFFLPDPAGCSGRVYVLLNSGTTPANLYTRTSRNPADQTLVYDDVTGDVLLVPLRARLTVQSNGASWLVLAR